MSSGAATPALLLCRASSSTSLAERARRLSLSAEQEGMVRAVTSSRERVLCVVGPAGSGKTSAVRVAVEGFVAFGVPVLGAAPSGIAAERLTDEAGVPATTLHCLLAAAQHGGGLPRGSVLVVDEAGMADTRVLAPLLALVEEAEGKAVLLGDPRQLPAVGAGGLFAAIVEARGRPHCATTAASRTSSSGGRSRPSGQAWGVSTSPSPSAANR